jgi:hypothetical protein
MKFFRPTILFLISIGLSQVLADTLIFKNGDQLNGKIIKRDPAHILFESSRFGTLELNSADLSEIRTESVPPIPPPPATPPAPPPPEKKKLAKKEPPKKKSKWSGQAGLAIAMREKNNTRIRNGTPKTTFDSYETYRVYGHVDWKGIKNTLNWKWIYRYSRDETKKRDDFFNLTQKYNHHFEKSPFYVEAKTIYQRDYNRGIRNEYLQTAELGRNWFNHSKFTLKTSIGGGYHSYDRLLPEGDRIIREPKFVIDESIRWQMLNSLALFQKYSHLGNFQDYQFAFSAGIENKLIQDLFLRFEYRLDRDTETSYDDTAFYDKALLTSLLYKF